jgi:pilus assembly protein CpaB
MIAFAVVFGLLAVFLANSWLTNRANEAMRSLEAQRKSAPPAHTIVVAARPLHFGDVLTSMALREMPWPADALPAGAFGKISDLTATKRIVLMPMETNEAVLAAKITGPGQRATLSSLLHEGMKAVTVLVRNVDDGVAGFVLPGDHVDVVLTHQGSDKTQVNDVLIQNVRVLGIDQTADQTVDKPAVVRAVTLEVNEADGQKLALASAVGTLSLMLRKAGEIAENRTRQLTIDDLSNSAPPPSNSRFATVVVTRPTKDSMTEHQYSVPIEHRDAHSAAIPAQEIAHK